MPIAIGTQLGSHEITGLLGRGGMGEVYRARDLKLKREVAIKVLPDEFSRDADRVSRFQREAEVLASLNHPNIATIYDLEEANDTRFLVLELVEGETLAQRIQRGPVRVQEALDIAKHICEALEAAHEKGIVHRDLKPTNVKMTPEGKVKVLDFGLAKAMEAGPQATLSNSPTLSQMATNAGVILGTAAYMSPEQARGQNADSRSDIFSFGCLLFEMLSGRQSFQGKTVSDVLASVLAREPDLNVLPAKLNPRIPQLICRALEKAAKQRWQAIGDVRVELEAIIAEGAMCEIERTQPKPLWKRAGPAVIASAVFSLITGLMVWNIRPSTPATITRFPITLPEGQQFTNTGRLALAISPDGAQFVYVADARLHLRSMSDVEPKAIPGTEGANVDSPAFSPDGRSVAFWVGDTSSNGFIKKIAIAGGPSVTLCPAANPYGLNWGQDGTILFGQGPGGIMRVSANGGRPEALISLKANELALQPQMLPGGDAVLFTLAALSGEDPKDRWDKARVVVQSLKTGERKILMEGGSDARYIPTGHIVYALGRTLFAIPFDVKRLSVGGPTPVVEGIRRFDVPNQTGVAHFSFSNSGSLIYIPEPTGGPTVGLQRSLVLMDRMGGVKTIAIPPGAYNNPRVSPDGKRIAFSTDDGKDEIIWIYDLSGTGSVRRLTFEGLNRSPIWSPDGQRVAYSIALGVKIALGTDAAVYPHGRNAVEFVLMAADGMSAVQALQAGTVRAAELLGLADTVGTLKPGFSADIVAVRGNPLTDLKATQDVIFVMKEGVVYKNAAEPGN